VTPCSVAVCNQRFGGWKQHGAPKRWYPTITAHGVTTQKTSTLVQWNYCASKCLCEWNEIWHLFLVWNWIFWKFPIYRRFFCTVSFSQEVCYKAQWSVAISI
jgi:hypothetical protein